MKYSMTLTTKPITELTLYQFRGAVRLLSSWAKRPILLSAPLLR
jgi:hypothetical protein